MESTLPNFLNFISHFKTGLSDLLAMVSPFLIACWDMLVEMAPYMCLGFLMAGLLHIFVNPKIIFKFLGRGRIKSVLYATLLGIPLPLCSCGVLPATAGLKKQGATNGAAMSFLIATPETGVDSMAVTYALLDPIMTIFRPLAAFVTSIAAGLTQNFFGRTYTDTEARLEPDLSCKIDNCCDGINCPPEVHRHHHSLFEKLNVALKYGFGEILDDISKWLVLGIVIAGAICVLVPDSFMKTYLDGGIYSMLTMLVVGIPFYICATSSTPIAAALILKGVSPGAALVFLLAGPATNAATISVVYGLFRKRATVIYLASIAICAIAMGLLLDKVYAWFKITASSVAGEAGEFIPHWMGDIFAVLLVILILNSFISRWRRKRRGEASCCDHDHGALVSGCGHEHGGSASACGHDHGSPVSVSIRDNGELTSGCSHGHEAFVSSCSYDHQHMSGIAVHGEAVCNHGHVKINDSTKNTAPKVLTANTASGPLASNHHNCGNDNSPCLKENDHSHDSEIDLKNVPDVIADQVANLVKENRRLRNLLIQRDLEIAAIKTES